MCRTWRIIIPLGLDYKPVNTGSAVRRMEMPFCLIHRSNHVRLAPPFERKVAANSQARNVSLANRGGEVREGGCHHQLHWSCLVSGTIAAAGRFLTCRTTARNGAFFFASGIFVGSFAGRIAFPISDSSAVHLLIRRICRVIRNTR
jgi:hypothetical protein